MHRTNRVPLLTPCCFLLLSAVLGDLALTGLAPAQEVAPQPRPAATVGNQLIVPIQGRVILTRKKIITNSSPSQPGIVQAQPMQGDPKSLILLGMGGGVVKLTLTYEDKTEETLDVIVQADVEYLRSLLPRASPSSNIQIIPIGGGQGGPTRVILTGTVQHAEEIDVIMRTAATVMGGEANIINALRTGGVQQVQLDVVVARVSRRETRRMNFDFMNAGQVHYLSGSVGQSITSLGTMTAGFPTVPTATATGTTGVGNIFLGLFNNRQQFFALLQLLRDENVGKLLAEPRLVTQSGRRAYFNSGGQQAVPQPGGLGTVSVQFQPFGTQVTFLPVVLGNGRIHLEVSPSITRLDQGFGTIIQGTAVPGRTEQTVQTTVEMEAGQSFMIGGLIEKTSDGTAIKVPILGDLPFIGTAFSSKSFTEDESELLIMVTPWLVDPLSCDQVPKVFPGQETRSPDDFELFLEGILEAPRGPRQVCKNRRYVPAWKHDVTAGAIPCAGRCGPGSHMGPCIVGSEYGAVGHPGGCAGNGCGGSGLADAPLIGYPGGVAVKPDSKADSGSAPNGVEVNHNAELLPPVEVDESSATVPVGHKTSVGPSSDGKRTNLPSLFGPTGYMKDK